MKAPQPTANDIDNFELVFERIRREIPEFNGDVEIQRIGGGQSNPTYFLNCDQIELVLRKRPAGMTGGAAHDVHREYNFLHSLRDSDLPVPKVYFYSDDLTLVGTDFYIMERVRSKQEFDSTLPGYSKEQKTQLYNNLALNLAKLHRVKWQYTPLKAYQREGDFLARQISRWHRAFEGSADFNEAKQVSDFLLANKPDDYECTIVHGDYKFSNLLLNTNSPSVAAIIDWELATIGDPLTDLAHTWASFWGTKPEEYGGLLGVDLDAAGIPSGDEFLAKYFEYNPIAKSLSDFYKVLALFRYAGIFQGIKKRDEDGTAASSTATEVGKLGRVYLLRALELVSPECVSE